MLEESIEIEKWISIKLLDFAHISCCLSLLRNKYKCLIPVFCFLFILNKSLMVCVCLRGKKWSSITKSVAFHSQPSFFCSQLKAPPAISNGSEMFSIVFLKNFLLKTRISFRNYVFAHHFRFLLCNFSVFSTFLEMFSIEIVIWNWL